MPLIVLDRDGVINEDSDDYVRSVAQWQPVPGSIEAIAALSQAGFTVAIASNQSGLGRGLFGLDELEAIHATLCRQVEEQGGLIAGIFYCPHLPDAGCHCRKPATGLLDAMAAEAGTRFLVVTHHPLTMARMHRLYGVTMQERGVSRLLSVDLGQAVQMAEGPVAA